MSAIKQDASPLKSTALSEPQDVEALSVQQVGDNVTQRERLDQIKLDHDELPLNWPASKKWTITILVAFISGIVTFASSVHASAVGMYTQPIVTIMKK